MAKVAAAGLDWDTALTYWQTVVRLLARDGDGYWRLARCAGQMMVMLNVAVGGAARALLGQERVTEVAAWLYPGQQAGLGVAVGWAHLAAGLQLTEEGQHAAAAVQYEAASKYAEDRGGRPRLSTATPRRCTTSWTTWRPGWPGPRRSRRGGTGCCRPSCRWDPGRP